MKSQGILSRYVRPGYSRGQYVQKAKEGDIGGGSRDYDKKRRELFRNPNIVLYSRKRLSDDNPYDYDYKELSPEEFESIALGLLRGADDSGATAVRVKQMLTCRREQGTDVGRRIMEELARARKMDFIIPALQSP